MYGKLKSHQNKSGGDIYGTENKTQAWKQLYRKR